MAGQQFQRVKELASTKEETNPIREVVAVQEEGPLKVQCYINGIRTEIDLDTGSPVTILTKQTWDRIKERASLQPANRTFYSFSGHKIQLLGKSQVKVEAWGKSTELDVFVAD